MQEFCRDPTSYCKEDIRPSRSVSMSEKNYRIKNTREEESILLFLCLY